MRDATWKDWASITVFVLIAVLTIYGTFHGISDPTCTPRPFSC